MPAGESWIAARLGDGMQGGRWIATMGAVVVLCGGCASRPAAPGPMAAASTPSAASAALDLTPTASVARRDDLRPSRGSRQMMAEQTPDFVGGDLGDDPGARPPRPSEIVAVRGGSIMAESSAEQAARKRQLAAMMKDVDPPRVDFGITTGSTPPAGKP